MENQIRTIINESIEIKKLILKNNNIKNISKIANIIISAYRNNKKVVVFGNGGSAADSQHFVAELVCRFEKERKSIPAIALTTNSSTLTAIGNDYQFSRVFSRQVESIVNPGDIVIGITTSGNSVNVIEGIKQAKKNRAITIGMTGNTGGKLKYLVDECICVPSTNTARIQECHILIIHILCKLIEDNLFK